MLVIIENNNELRCGWHDKKCNIGEVVKIFNYVMNSKYLIEEVEGKVIKIY